MKRFWVLGLMAACLLVFAACGAIQERVDANVYERIHRQLINMESFAAQATVTYISNNNSHTYETLQHALSSGQYRIEVISPINVAGNTTIFDGTTISQYNLQLDGRVMQTTTEAPERIEILLTSFVRNFIRTTESTVSVANLEGALTTVLEATIEGEHPYLSLQRLWVDNETLTPVRMVILDAQGAERVIVEYSNFEFNVNIAPELFIVPQE